MVITVESGIHLAYRAFGMRIEEVLRASCDGHEWLTAAVPRTPDKI